MSVDDIEDIVFEPRYPPLVLLAVYGLPVSFFGLLCAAASLFGQLPPLFWMMVLLLGVLAALAPFFFIRRIVFREKMVIRRYFLPDVYLDYRDVQAVDAGAIHTPKKKIRLGNPQNLVALQDLTQRWQAVRVLQESNRRPKGAATLELPTRGYGSYGFIWGLMFGILVMYLVPVNWNIDSRWIFGSVFLLTYLLFTYILPRKL